MYKTIRPTTFDELTMNVFMLVSAFTPATFDFEAGVDASTIIGSTTGGVNMADEASYTDLGDDIDNCPKNCMELKHKEDGNVHISGNLVTLSVQLLQRLIASADVDGNKITPRVDLLQEDFMTEVWGLADYGNGGLLAIKMKRVLNTSGLSISTTDNNKAQFAFDFVCHKTISNVKDSPYEIYIIVPDEPTPETGIELNKHSITVTINDNETLTATTVPASSTVSWTSSNSEVASVSSGVVTGEAAGNAIIAASITVDGVTYNDTCTVIVVAAEENEGV